MSVEMLADANLIESFRAYARCQQDSELEERDGVLMMAGATRFPASFMNAAIRLDARVAPEQAVQRAQEFFAQRNRGFSFVTRKHCDADLNVYLAAAEFARESDAPCMLLEASLADAPLPHGVRVETLDSANRVADLIHVGANAYKAMGLPAKQAQAAFSRAAGLLEARVTGVIAYCDDEPVSMALTIHANDSAGVYWVGTVPNARGKGLGELCTRLATNAGFARGAGVVTLQASADGAPLYRRMGFREYDRRFDYRKP